MAMTPEQYKRMMGKLGINTDDQPVQKEPKEPRPAVEHPGGDLGVISDAILAPTLVPDYDKAQEMADAIRGNGHVDVEDEDSQDFGGYDYKFKQEDWQVVDMIHLEHYRDVMPGNPAAGVKNVGTANWSEMGCYKTSTGIWLAERCINDALTRNTIPGPKIDKNPSVLIITSKGGKGTFLEALPEILPEWTIINIETNSLNMYKNGHMLKLPQTHKFVPKEFAFPCIALAHYDIFSRSNFGQPELDDDDMPIIIDGKIVFKPFTQCDYITTRMWDYVWCDEFHRLKDRKARWTVQIKKIKTTVGKHGSTGTGFINRPQEIWSLLDFLHKGEYGTYWSFYEEFVDTYTGDDGKTYIRGVKPEKLEKFRKMVRTIGVRRELDQVMPHIKKPIFKPELVDLNDTQRRMYNEITMQLKALDQAGVELYAANVLSLLQRQRQICVGTPEVVSDTFDPDTGKRHQSIKLIEPSTKIDKVMEILEELQWDDDKKEPLVVFSCFKDPLELLKTRLDKHNVNASEMGLDDMMYKYIHLDVGDSDVVRYRKWHDDFPTLEYRVFMSTLQLGGESINLTPARHCVFLDRSWSPKDNSQAIGRIRRPGQEGQPVVIHINAAQTTDQYVEQVNDTKQGWFNQIFGNDPMI